MVKKKDTDEARQPFVSKHRTERVRKIPARFKEHRVKLDGMDFRAKITPAHIHWLRGLLIVRYHREINCRDLAAVTGTSYRLIQSYSKGERRGTPSSIRKIIRGFAAAGIVIHERDFYGAPPAPDNLVPYELLVGK